MRKGKEYEIHINDVEFPGYGVGEFEDKKVYIKNTLPGETVKARITKNRREYAEGKLVEIIEDADYKIDAECPHFYECGGCSHQFISYDKQLELKEKGVKKLFDEAEISGFEYLGINSSPDVFEYRNKMEFTFGDYEKGGELSLGMHIKGKSFGIITVDNCKLVDEDYRKVLKITVEYFRSKGLSHYRVLSHEGFLRNLVIREGKNTGELIVNIVTTSQLEFDFTEYVQIIKNSQFKGKLVGIIHTVNDSLSDVVQEDKMNILYGKDYIIEDLLGLKFKITPFSFFQTNSHGAEKLYSIVRDFLGDVSSKVVFDLYCGTGTIGQIVAPKAEKVIGVELIEEAVEAANENAKLNGLSNCKFIAGDVAKVIGEIKDKPDVIILDPPRAGVHPIALKYVVDFNAPDIIYVSCNPKTLVNDLKFLTENGYKIEKVTLMDMFPHTPHVECVVGIRRKDSL